MASDPLRLLILCVADGHVLDALRVSNQVRLDGE